MIISEKITPKPTKSEIPSKLLSHYVYRNLKSPKNRLEVKKAHPISVVLTIKLIRY